MPLKHLIAAVLAALPIVAEGALSLELSLSPAHTLPGLPVSFNLTVNNPDAAIRHLPGTAVLVVTPAGGEPFFAFIANSRIAADLAVWQMGTATVQPRGHYSFDIPLDWTLGNPPWFYDARLNRPGSYRLQVVLCDSNDEKLRGVKPAFLSGALPPGFIVSNEAVLTVDTPTGDDAAVWRLIAAENDQRIGAAAWLGGGTLMRRIWTEHPASTYARYVVVRVPLSDREKQIAAIESAQAVDPAGPFADWQQLQIAELENQLYGAARGRAADSSILTAHAQRAVTIYRAVVKAAHSTLARSVAQHKLDDFLADLADDGIAVR